MTRRFKIPGLALAIVLAMSSIPASVATAQTNHQLTAEATPVTITGGQTTKHVFTTSAGIVECKVATFTSTMALKEQDTLTVTPDYTECTFTSTIFGPVEPATVTMNNCDFQFASDTTVQGYAPIALLCPTTTDFPHITHQMEIHLPKSGCTWTIPEQTTTKGVTYTQQGSGTTADLLVNFAATWHNIKGHGPFFPCSLFFGNIAEYTGTSTWKGEAEGENPFHIGIGVHQAF